MAGVRSAPAPTGCYKCGRPGHWSRDCPSSSTPSSAPPPSPWQPKDPPAPARPAPKSKPPSSLPRKRPKLTPDLLLSEDGLGYVLERFPRMSRIQGPGHEVEDLGRLLEAYMHWHSRVLPYFSFEQFVEKLEKVGATKRVRVCVHELRQKVYEPADPGNTNNNKLEKDVKEDDEDLECGKSQEIEDNLDGDLFPTDVQEELIEEVLKQATEEDAQVLHTELDTTMSQPGFAAIEAVRVVEAESYPALAVKGISEEQRVRMEANRLKALERAKTRTAL